MHIGPTITEELEATRAYHREAELRDAEKLSRLLAWCSAAELRLTITCEKRYHEEFDVDGHSAYIYHAIRASRRFHYAQDWTGIGSGSSRDGLIAALEECVTSVQHSLAMPEAV